MTTVVTQANIDWMWQQVIMPRVGDVYVFGGSLNPNARQIGTDCSGAVSEVNEAILYGPQMNWTRQFWTGTFAGYAPGDHGPFEGVDSTSNWVCMPGPYASPTGAVMRVAVLQLSNPEDAHMVCEVLDPNNVTGHGGPGRYVGVESGGRFTDAQGNSTLHIGSIATSVGDPMFNQWFYLDATVGDAPVTVKGLDYAGGRISGADIASAGYQFVCRYLFDGSPSLPAKLLTKAEADNLQGAGLGVVSNWESDGVSPLNGYNQGVVDATKANANHLAAGGPPTRPIYFSIDFDEAENQDGVIEAYFQGAASVIGLSRTGAYGGYWPLKRLFDAGVITWGWQTEAWSSDPGGLAPLGPDGDYLDPRVNILQRNSVGYVTIGGVQCDENEAQTADYGQWNYTATPPPGGGGTIVTGISESPFRPLGDQTPWPTDQLDRDTNGMLHPVYVEWCAARGDSISLQILQAMSKGDPVQFPDRARDIELAQQCLARVVAGTTTPPTPVVVQPNVVVPDVVTPVPVVTPVVPSAGLHITLDQLLGWGKDLITVIGTIGTWATAIHGVLGQYLPPDAQVAVPSALAATTIVTAGHQIHQKRQLQKTIKGQ